MLEEEDGKDQRLPETYPVKEHFFNYIEPLPLKKCYNCGKTHDSYQTRPWEKVLAFEINSVCSTCKQWFCACCASTHRHVIWM